MSDTSSDYSSDNEENSQNNSETLTPEEVRQIEIRAKKLESLEKARVAAKKSLLMKGELKRNEKDIKERDRLLKLTEQREIKRKQSEELTRIQKQQKKLEKMKTSKPVKVYKEKALEKEPEPSSSESESESDSDSEPEEELTRRIVKKRAKKTRDKCIRQQLSEELEKEKWRILGAQISGRI